MCHYCYRLLTSRLDATRNVNDTRAEWVANIADELQKYLEVRPEQVRGAVAALAMLSPVEEETVYFGKPFYDEVESRVEPQQLESPKPPPRRQ